MRKTGRPDLGGNRRAIIVLEALERRNLLTSVVVNTILDGLFPTSTGIISMRNAVAIANASTTLTAITFNAKVFSAPQTIVLNGSRLELTNRSHVTTISGPSATLTVSGNSQSPVFWIDKGVTANISALTVTKGVSGVVNLGTATLSHVIISKNTASGEGGGIYNTGTLSLANASILGNAAPHAGGGIYNSGIATLMNVTVDGNSTPNLGAGIFTDTGSTTTIVDATVSRNASGDDGGGMVLHGPTTLTNVTVSGNTAANHYGFESVGGIEFDAGGATLTNVTIVGNSGVGGSGGGIRNFGGPGLVITLANCIVAGNSISGGGFGPDASGQFNSLGNNLVGKKDGSTGWNAADLTGTAAKPLDAKLSPLGNYGGTLQTMPPLPGSMVINHGSNVLLPHGITTDERGLARIVNGTVDIGAVEFQTLTTGSIGGTMFNDANGNGGRDPGEMGLGLWQVFIDQNNDGKMDGSDIAVTTDVNGNWSFKGLIAGTYTVRVVPVAGNVATKPTSGVTTIKLAAGQASSGNLFGEKAIA